MKMPMQRSLVAAALAIAACWFSLLSVRAAESGPAGPSAASQDGTLQIVGKGIERLVLVNTSGSQRILERPGPNVSVPAGTYYVHQVRLQGGFESPGGARHLFTIAPGQAGRLEVGGPLTSTVEVRRCGGVLKIDYALIGVDQCKYTREDRSAPPRFTIYQGDREIGSGSFEYG